MGNKLWKLTVINRSDYIISASALLIVAAVVHTIAFVALKFFGETSSVMMLEILLPVVAAVLMMIFSMGHVLTTFDQALRFGCTRKKALMLAFAQIALLSLLNIALSAVLSAAERILAPKFWLLLSGCSDYILDTETLRIPEGMSRQDILQGKLFIESMSLEQWWALPVIILCGAVAGVIAGAIVHRFGRKGGWVIWAAWMCFCIAFPQLPWQTSEVTNWLIPLLIVLVAASLLWSVHSLLRACIRS